MEVELAQDRLVSHCGEKKTNEERPFMEKLMTTM